MSRLKAAVDKRLQQHTTINRQKHLAEFLGISEAQFSRHMRNRRRRLTGDQVLRLASFLNVSPDELLEILSDDSESAESEDSIETLKRKLLATEEEQRQQAARLREMETNLRRLQRALEIKHDLEGVGTHDRSETNEAI